MKIIILNGHNQSGKDKLADLIAGYHKPTVKLSTIWDTQIPKIAEQAGWDGKKDERGRQLLCDLKDAQTRYNNGPFLDVCAIINRWADVIGNAWATVMCREPAEIQKFVEAYPGQTLTVLVRRDGEPANNHADQNVEDFVYDVIIENNGTEAELATEAFILTKNIENLGNDNWQGFKSLTTTVERKNE